MRKAKVKKVFLDDYGKYLGMEKGCIIVKEKSGKTEKYPLFDEEIGEVVVKTGNMVSTGVLASLGFWEIDLLVLTRGGRPVAYLRSVDYDSHAETRIAQYKAYVSNRGVQIAKQLVLSEIQTQNVVLRKYGLKQHSLPKAENKIEAIENENLCHARTRLLNVEGRFSKDYINSVFQLLPEWLRPEKRLSFQAYDGGNNLFNLAYEILKWKVHKAIIRAKLEPYLGFMHSLQFGKPSLVCDFQDLYRFLIDDFLLEYCQKIRKTDFKAEFQRKKGKIGKRIFLKDRQTKLLVRKLYEYFERKIEIPRIRKYGKEQKIETLINEEALLFAKYLRNEREKWIPRIPKI